MAAKSISSCIIGKRVYKNHSFLKSLARTTSEKKRKELLKKANCEELLTLVEICTNILASTFCLSESQRKKLLPYANFVRNLSRARCEKSARKIVQTGNGFVFPALLVPVLVEIARVLLK